MHCGLDYYVVSTFGNINQPSCIHSWSRDKGIHWSLALSRLPLYYCRLDTYGHGDKIKVMHWSMGVFSILYLSSDAQFNSILHLFIHSGYLIEVSSAKVGLLDRANKFHVLGFNTIIQPKEDWYRRRSSCMLLLPESIIPCLCMYTAHNCCCNFKVQISLLPDVSKSHYRFCPLFGMINGPS